MRIALAFAVLSLSLFSCGRPPSCARDADCTAPDICAGSEQICTIACTTDADCASAGAGRFCRAWTGAQTTGKACLP